MSTLIYHDLSMSTCYMFEFSYQWDERKQRTVWMMMIANTAGVKKMGGFNWAHMLHKKTFKWQDSHTCGAINLWKWDSLSHPQLFVTTCFHHSNLIEMNLTQNILFIFKHFMYQTKNIRNQDHCHYVHKFTDYTHYEQVQLRKRKKEHKQKTNIAHHVRFAILGSMYQTQHQWKTKTLCHMWPKVSSITLILINFNQMKLKWTHRIYEGRRL